MENVTKGTYDVRNYSSNSRHLLKDHIRGLQSSGIVSQEKIGIKKATATFAEDTVADLIHNV